MQFLKPFQLCALAVSCLLVVSSCSDDDNGNGDDPSASNTAEARRKILENTATNIIIPAFQAFSQSTDTLQNKLKAFADAPSTSTLSEAKEQLQSTRLAWERVTLYGFGPAGDEMLRNTVNTFPVDTQGIEQNITTGDYNLGAKSNLDKKGFVAMGYLLHHAPAQTVVEEFQEDSTRQQYLKDLAADAETLAQNASDGWDESYRQNFISNTGIDKGSSFSMLYNEMLKDYENLRRFKIGQPAGVGFAGAGIRPELLEAYFGGYSKPLAQAHLQSFITTFQGGDGQGFDDYLSTLGAETTEGQALEAAIQARLDGADKQVDALPDDMRQALANENTQPFKNARDSLQTLIPLMKVDVPNATEVSITFQDSDGD
jgi:hypothetical protein